jgi:hypothetical protein
MCTVFEKNRFQLTQESMGDKIVLKEVWMLFQKLFWV